ncbi:MAG: DNA polymerase I [Paraglaciecola sp.]|uniref:DNA polymerase I n=1 Tax=Paraglaciecola sp. TaxID=1920173 RepID=UPI00273D89DE|nr:DNA polymerase I [Paraglaciecola sp.]MDP5032691.1 DNA polymerase I [Paraglaciecola sp.]MDP5134147.1 DNA polymerase I [Paraglaciecola sp.]
MASEQILPKRSPLILVDGSSYLFRAYHVPYLQALKTSYGQPTGAITGVLNMIKSLQKDYPNGNVVVVFDAKGKTFRNDLYPEYKANRPPMPDDLRSQIEPLHNIIKAMGLPLLVIDGVEADDVIGTLANQATQQSIETIISTGDKDMAQLVSPHVTLINTMTNQKLDEAGVVEKFGVAPNQIIDYLALMGDKVDNIPGVDKCGPKTAVKWLIEFGNLQNVINNADLVKGKVGENLRAAADKLPLSYELATIKLDVELPFLADELCAAPQDTESLIALSTQYELKRLLNDVQRPSNTSNDKTDSVSNTEELPPETNVSKDKYQTILSMSALKAWLDKLNSCELFAFDTETTSLNYMEAELVGMSFCIEEGEAAYLPLAHNYPDAPEQLDLQEVLALFKPLLENPTIKKVGQHLKYDKNVLANYDIELAGIAFDTMLESYVLNSVGSRHDMDTLAAKYLDHQTVHFEDIAGKGAKQIGFNLVNLEQASPYAAEDADVTLRLHNVLWKKLSAETSLVEVLEKVEIPLLSVLAKMEQFGVLIDSQKLGQQTQDLATRIIQLEKEVHELAGQSFNLGSTKQLQEILYTKMNLPVLKKTPKGAPSTSEEVLQELALDYPLPKLLMEFRGLTKLKNTYTDKLPKMINARTGRVHTSYHQAVAATGRLSSTEPNLQNIPIRTEEGRRVRQAFIARPGYKIVAADYSQIELRIMAHLSKDSGLISAFAAGIDIHSATAAEVFSVPLEKVTTEQRRNAKAINFGLIYGMSAFGLSRQLNISRQDAQKYMNLYFERYPGVLKYMDETRQVAKEQGYVETVFGRRLYLPEINSSNVMQRKGAERAAINAPMQGTAADVIKKAMLCVDKWISTLAKDEVRMIMQVHDELVFEIKQQELEMYRTKIIELMEQAVVLDVPLTVEAGIGENWDEAH